MKVLFVERVSGIAGAEVYGLELLRELKAAGVDCAVLCAHDARSRPAADEFVNRLRDHGVVVYRTAANLMVVRDILRRVRDEGFSIVHSNLIHADLWAALAKVRRPRAFRLVSTKHGYRDAYQALHGLDAKHIRRDLFYRVQRFIHRHVDRTITVSAALKALFVDAGLARAETIDVVHLGVRPQPSTDSGACAKRLLIVGRLTAVKGHLRVLRVMPRLLAQHPDASLVIVGDGPMRAELERFVGHAGLEAHVRFEGAQSGVATYYRASDVVLTPSTSEGFGLVVLEAFSHGRPVVAFDVPAINEIIEHGVNGYLVPPFDEQALLERLTSLLSDDAARTACGARARQTVEAKFALDRMVRETIAIYASL